MVKILFIIVDGIGDCGSKALGWKTVFQAQDLPHLDRLAASGVNGLMDSFEAGYSCGSDTSHLNLFGYPPLDYYKGRGAFETEGAGLVMQPGDIAFKSNMAYMNPETLVVEKRRVDREFDKWGLELIRFLDGMTIPGYEEYKVSTKHATEHRLGVNISGPGLSNEITDNDPLADNLKLLTIKALKPEAEFTAKLVSDFHQCNALSDEIHRKLASHPLNLQRVKEGKLPANMVMLRGCGIKIKAQPFEEKFGTRAISICPTAIIGGVMLSINVERVVPEGATGDYHTNLLAKSRKAHELLYSGGYEFCFLHVKAYDEAGHDKLLDERIKIAVKVDEMVHDFMQRAAGESEDCIVVITGDHSTPMYHGDHTFEPVPVTITTKDAYLDKRAFFLRDACSRFDEIEAARGSLGRFDGVELMPLIFKLRDKLSSAV